VNGAWHARRPASCAMHAGSRLREAWSPPRAGPRRRP